MSQAWEYDGVDLTTYAYNVALLGAPLSTPARRGENVVVPHKEGRTHVAKCLDERVQTLAMWVIGCTTGDTTQTVTEAQMLANLDALRGLFARSGQHTLKFAYGSTTRVATVEVVRQVEFEPKIMNGAYVFVVDFLMADPLWYAESATTVGPTTITGSPQNITVNNAGSYQSLKGVFTVTGAITDPKLAIGSYYLQYTGTVAAGHTLIFNCATFTATLDGTDVTGDVTHDGGVYWLPIPASATNTLTVTGSAISGATVTCVFTAPFV